jgi:hypothetical protein
MTKQINVATVAGTVTGSGNASVKVTAALMDNSPKTIAVAVLNHDTAADVALKIRYALATDVDVSNAFLIGGSSTAVQLTSRIDAANDPLLNVAIDNDTCAGLTPAPTSTTTVQGVATITNGYCTLAEMKAYGLPKAQNSPADDTTLSLLIESASREAEHISRRKFYLATETHYFDTPLANQTPPVGNYLTSPTNPPDSIMFDDDLQTVTSITNGDGSVLDPSTYVLKPYGKPPYYAVQLRPTSGVMWNTNAGDPLAAIQVLGAWGYNAGSTPVDIKEGVMMIVKEAYNRRFGENMTSRSIITTGGVIITPEDIPEKAMEIFLAHRRVPFG